MGGRKHNIKHMKPHKNGKYKQGYINPKNCRKLFEGAKNQPIIYRSGLELQFIQFFEQCPKIKYWASEPFNIEYFSRLDNKQQNYYPDFLVETTSGTPIIVEIKPDNQTQRPDITDTLWAKEAWVKNTDKWNAAKEFAHNKGMKFVILTEKFFD